MPMILVPVEVVQTQKLSRTATELVEILLVDPSDLLAGGEKLY
jgi:hypothetical protein